MVGVRDIGWAIAVCIFLTVFVQCRAQRAVEASIERDAKEAFLQAYDGARYVTGELVTPGHGGYVDPMAPAIEVHRLDFQAERQSVTGGSFEVVARHVIRTTNGTATGADESQEVHAKLERQHGQWVYTLFETRDGQVLDDPGGGNPWARALLARKQAARPFPVDGGGAEPRPSHGD